MASMVLMVTLEKLQFRALNYQNVTILVLVIYYNQTDPIKLYKPTTHTPLFNKPNPIPNQSPNPDPTPPSPPKARHQPV